LPLSKANKEKLSWAQFYKNIINQKEWVCKPSSVSPSEDEAAIIYLGLSLPASSCDLPAVIARAEQQLAWSCRRWGLPCRRRHRRRGALLPHHFTFACRTHRVGAGSAVYFLWHFPAGHPGWPLATTVALSCSDFPPAEKTTSDRPTHSF